MRFFEFTPEKAPDCSVKAWIHTNNETNELMHRMNPAIIICPGGGYGAISAREAEPVAQCYFAAGYNTFILTYSVGEKARNFQPLMQLASTIAHIRKNSDEWFTAKDQIAVCGFSAGGHLAASLGTLFNEERFLNVFGGKENIRPDAMILGYPVITSDEFAHVRSIGNVSGAEVGSAEFIWFGLDRHVDEQTPPAFLWHTAEDASVSVENSLRMASALSKASVPFELHVLPHGVHGMSVCTEEVRTKCDYNGRWVDWSIEWLNKLFQFRG
ncbi:MAG: alpha/beta hydrolase [Faecalimonas sp.]|nr:alpha/beta hydrolase [Faecalimonas sp.]